MAKNNQTTDQAGADDGGGKTSASAAAAQQQQQDPRAASGSGFQRRPLIVGEPVQYLPTGNDAKPCAAFITRIDDNGEVGLYVLRAEFNAPEWRDGVKEGKGQGDFRRLEDALDEARA